MIDEVVAEQSAGAPSTSPQISELEAPPRLQVAHEPPPSPPKQQQQEHEQQALVPQADQHEHLSSLCDTLRSFCLSGAKGNNASLINGVYDFTSSCLFAKRDNATIWLELSGDSAWYVKSTGSLGKTAGIAAVRTADRSDLVLERTKPGTWQVFDTACKWTGQKELKVARVAKYPIQIHGATGCNAELVRMSCTFASKYIHSNLCV